MKNRRQVNLIIGGVLIAILIIAAVFINLPSSSKDKSKAEASNSLKVAPIEGALAPNFSLPSYNGGTVSLSEFKGKKVIVTFWSLTCPSCRMELPQLDRLAGNSDVVVIAVVHATPQQLNAYFLQHSYFQGRKPNFIVAMDPNYYTFRMYQIRFTPTNYIIDQRGVIRKIIIGAVSRDYMTALLNSL